MRLEWRRFLLSTTYNGRHILLNATLIILILYRKNYHVFPFFFLFILLDFLYGVAVLESYRLCGFNSMTSFKIYWGTQALVMMARVLAVTETCQPVLAKRWGFWESVWRVSLALANLVFLCAWAVGPHSLYLIMLITDRALELAIALGIVLVFLFARHMEADPGSTVHALAAGFFLISSFRALNDTILERWRNAYVTLWNFNGTVSFLSCLLLWTWALRRSQPGGTFEPELR